MREMSTLNMSWNSEETTWRPCLEKGESSRILLESNRTETNIFEIRMENARTKQIDFFLQANWSDCRILNRLENSQQAPPCLERTHQLSDGPFSHSVATGVFSV